MKALIVIIVIGILSKPWTSRADAAPCCQAPVSYNEMATSAKGIDNAVIPKTFQCAKEFATDPTLVNHCIQEALKGFTQVAFWDFLKVLKKGAIETSRFSVGVIPGGNYILKALNIRTTGEVWGQFLARNGPKAEAAAKFLYRIHTDDIFALEVAQRIGLALGPSLALASRQYLNASCSDISKSVCNAIGKASPAVILSIGFTLLTIPVDAVEAAKALAKLRVNSPEVAQFLHRISFPVELHTSEFQNGLYSVLKSKRTAVNGDTFYTLLSTPNPSFESGHMDWFSRKAPLLLKKYGISVSRQTLEPKRPYQPLSEVLVAEHPDVATANRIADRLAKAGDQDAPILRFYVSRGSTSPQEFITNWINRKAPIGEKADGELVKTDFRTFLNEEFGIKDRPASIENKTIFHDNNVHAMAYRMLPAEVLEPSIARARFLDGLSKNSNLMKNEKFQGALEGWKAQFLHEVDSSTAALFHYGDDTSVNYLQIMGRGEENVKAHLREWAAINSPSEEIMSEVDRITDLPSYPSLTRGEAEEAWRQIKAKLR